MKNIALIIPSLKIGGCERSVSNITTALESKYNISLVLFDGERTVYPYGGHLINMNLPARKSILGKIYNSFHRILKMKSIINKNNIEIAYMFLSKSNILNYCKLGKTKKIVSCRGFGDLLAGERYYSKMLNSSEAIIFNSKQMLYYFSKKYPAFKDKLYYAYNLFDLKFIEKKSHEQVEQEFTNFIQSHRTIISVGRFCKEKGFNDLIKSFEILKQKVPNAGLVLIGDGELYRELEDLAKSSKYPSDIMLLGYKDNPYKYIAKCDIYALSSTNEGFPNVVIEAMACGLPVICTNCLSGPNEILYDKFILEREVKEDFIEADYGILTPCFEKNNDYDINNLNINHHIYASALCKMLLDEDIRNLYRKMSIIRSEHFSFDKGMQKYIDIFESIAKG